MPENLLAPDFLHKLERLELVSRKIFAGRMKGERRSKRRGASVEFADHRSYVTGDDLRFIDWNILIRLDRLFVKLFEEEEDLHFSLLLDTSASMGFGEPTKLQFARRLAAALAFVGLVRQDRVAVAPFADGLGDGLPPSRGRHSYWRVHDFLAKLEPNAAGDFERACKAFAMRPSTRGVVVVLSDFLDKAGFDRGLKYLVARNLDIFAVQILAAEELDPELAGDLRLTDVEDGDVAEITVSAPLLARYKANVQSYLATVKDYCTKRGMNYLFATNQTPVETLILSYFRQRGLLK